MKLKEFLPKITKGKWRFSPVKTVVSCLLIALLLISTSVGLGFSKFRIESEPLFTAASTTVMRVDNGWVVVKERTAGEDTVFTFLDGKIKVTVPASATGEVLDKSKYLVVRHEEYLPTYTEDSTVAEGKYQYKIRFSLTGYHFADLNSGPANIEELAVDESENPSMSIAFKISGDPDEYVYVAGYPQSLTVSGPDSDGWVTYRGISQFDTTYYLNYDMGTDWTDVADTSWYDDSETSFTLSTAEELAGLAKLVNDDTEDFTGCTITLDGNIDRSGKTWTAIGTAAHPFKGTFDGGNKTISDMTIHGVVAQTNDADNTAGLFGTVSGAAIKNITVKDAVINANLGANWNDDDMSGNPTFVGQSVGTVVGRADSGSTIDNAHAVNPLITCTSKYVGGILGRGIYSGSVTNCSVEGATITPENAGSVGGIVGLTYSTISDCYVSADLGGYYTACGGIAAFAANGAANMTKCYFTGDIAPSDKDEGFSIRAGLLAGMDDSAHPPYVFDNCFADTTIEHKIFGATNENINEEDVEFRINASLHVDWTGSADAGTTTYQSAEGATYSIYAGGTWYSSNMNYTAYKNAKYDQTYYLSFDTTYEDFDYQGRLSGTVTSQSGDTNNISESGMEVHYGDTVHVIAIPPEGAHVEGFSLHGSYEDYSETEENGNPTMTFTVTGDVTVYANWMVGPDPNDEP